MALNYITSIATGQSIFVEDTTPGAPTATAARGSIAIVNVAGAVDVYLNTSAGVTGNTWASLSAGSAASTSFNATSSGLKVPATGAAVTTVQQAIDAIAAGEIVAVFVFDPNAAADVGNVYNDFATLYAAFSRVTNGVQRRIQFLKANAGTTTIPAGSYDFRNTEWVGDPAKGLPTPIAVADGASISGSGNARPPWRIEALNVQFLGTTPFCAVSTGFNTIWLDKGAILDSSGATQSPFVATTAADGFTVQMTDGSRILVGGGPFVFQLTVAGMTSSVALYDNAIVDANTLTVAAGSTWTIYVNGAAASYATTQGGAGTYTVNYAPFNYVPAVVGDWSGLAPTSLQNALDRIAAALGPIA